MDIGSIRTAIKSVVASLAGDSAIVLWRDEPRPFQPVDRVFVWLSFTAITGPANGDETLYVSNGTDDIRETIVERRGATLSIRSEALAADAGAAMQPIENIRSGLWRASSAAALNAAGVAVARIVDSRDFEATIDSRRHSVAVCDVRLRFASTVLGDTLSFIETAEVTGP